MKALWALCRAAVRLSLRPDDSPEQQQHKETWITVFCTMSPFSIVVFLVIILYEHGLGRAMTVGSLLIATASQVALIYPVLTGQLSTRFVGLTCIVVAVGLLTMDLHAAAWASSFRGWMWVVLIMDLLLVLNVPRSYQSAVLCLAVVHLFMVQAEYALRWGLFDIDVFTESSGDAAKRCDCGDPPCKESFGEAVTVFCSGMVIMFGDFYVTRGFSEDLRGEQKRMLTAVRVSERVTQLLAAYATGDARKVVAEEGTALPEALRKSYEELLDNLDSYRVFLPDCLLYAAQLPSSARDETGSSRQGTPLVRLPPGTGMDNAQLAICFTDIQGSTELWETRPQGMYDGLNLHNSVMRDVYGSCNGYEVKTIGDSFMVAFDDSLGALAFGLKAQQQLVAQKWPLDLLTHPLCQHRTGEDDERLWGGLRVRVAVHYGPARVERNPVTGRADYFGHTVNIAARLEGFQRQGGLVATSDAVVDGLGMQGLAELGYPALHDCGNRELKGVKDLMQVWLMAPQVLKGRFAVLTEELIFSPRSSCRRRDSSLMQFRRTRSVSRSGRGSRSPCSVSELSEGSQVLSSRSIGSGGIALRMQQTHATCAAARAPLSSCGGEFISECVSSAVLAADQTVGVVDGVLSACVFVTWNASRACPDHTAACSKFFVLLSREPRHRLGMASGTVLSGSIAAGRRSFTTVTGGIVELAAALAEEAERCGDAALAFGAVAEERAAAGDAFCAQLWAAPGVPSVVVYEMSTEQNDVDQLLGVRQHSRLAGDGELDGGLPALLVEACSAVPGSREHEAVLKDLQRLSAVSPEAARLLVRVQAGNARIRPMPPLWAPAPRDTPATFSASAVLVIPL